MLLNVHSEARALLLRASLTTVGLGRSVTNECGVLC